MLNMKTKDNLMKSYLTFSSWSSFLADFYTYSSLVVFEFRLNTNIIKQMKKYWNDWAINIQATNNETYVTIRFFSLIRIVDGICCNIR